MSGLLGQSWDYLLYSLGHLVSFGQGSLGVSQTGRCIRQLTQGLKDIRFSTTIERFTELHVVVVFFLHHSHQCKKWGGAMVVWVVMDSGWEEGLPASLKGSVLQLPRGETGSGSDPSF